MKFEEITLANALEFVDKVPGHLFDNQIVNAIRANAPLYTAVLLACIPVGLFLCFVGYKHFRMSIGILGGLCATVIASKFASNLAEFLPAKFRHDYSQYVIMLLIGLLAGMLCVYVYRMGLFVVGCVGGYLLVHTIEAAIPNAFAKLNNNIAFVYIAAMIICAILVRVMEKVIAVVITASVGASLVLGSTYHLILRHKESIPKQIPVAKFDESMSILIAICLSVTGMVVQFLQLRGKRKD